MTTIIRWLHAMLLHPSAVGGDWWYCSCGTKRMIR